MNTKIFFAFEGKIPRGIIRDLQSIGADCRERAYDSFLKEEFCYLRVKTKQSMIRVMHYFQNLNDFHFKYYYPMDQAVETV